MSFRVRLFLAISLALLVPLVVLALGVRREMDRRLGEESRRRGEAAVTTLSAELSRERERVDRQVSELARELAADNRFRLAAIQGDPASRAYLLDWAGGAMRLAGLAMLQVQDSAGRILSSGHFRNEYDRVRPALPAFVLEAGRHPCLIRTRTADTALLALAAAERFTVAGRPFSVVGASPRRIAFFGGSTPIPISP